MNSPSQDQITVQFSGQISVSREKLIKLLSGENHPQNPPDFSPPPKKINWPEKSEKKRLAYTLREAAEILGVHHITVHRLIQRGLLKSSKALRKVIIPAAEIERFLKETL